MKKYIIVFISYYLTQFGNFSPIYAINDNMFSLYNELKQPDLDDTKIAAVENIIIHRDVATFHLKEGNIYFLKPISILEKKYVTGAIFKGQGTFSFSPPTKIEKEQLARFYKDETFELEFKVLFLRFADSTFVELEKQISFHQTPIPKEIEKEKSYCERYISEPRNKDIIYSLLSSLISDKEDGYFYAHLSKEEIEPVFFIYNPNNVEEVQFQNRLIHVNYIRQNISQFHKQEDYKKGINFDEENKDVIAPTHYQIEVLIEPNGYFSAKTNMEFDVIDEEVNMINYLLSSKLKVEKILDENGLPLSFVRKYVEPYVYPAELIIFLNNPLKKGDKTKISIKYDGKILESNWQSFYIKSSVFWYPRYGYRKRATYDLTFKTPKKYKFISIGKKIQDKKKGKYRITQWVQKVPIVNVSFNLGSFKTYDIDVEEIVPITVFMSKEGRSKITHYLSSQGITVGKNMEKQVGADIANSIQLFNHLFGPYPYEKIFATEIPYGHGESFPGLLHLSWYTFQTTSEWGYSEIFRAHEVAHQWWGVTVGLKTYHDQWLSEGFSQYAGLWYMQWILKDTKKFFRILNEWQDQIFTNRKYILGSGAEAGPIWLGYRTSSTKTRGDYYLIVYKKGAFVLHMLRNMLIDLNTMNEDRFINMLRDFFETYKGKNASTEDFKKIVEKHSGMDMDWFFNQWIYGTDLPTYKFSYSTSKRPDGKYLVTCRVVQENVPDDFKMYVPITIRFKGNKLIRLRTLIDKPITEFSLPLLPLKPKEIIFNDFNSVLAKVKYE